jgi:hypothetical protein
MAARGAAEAASQVEARVPTKMIVSDKAKPSRSGTGVKWYGKENDGVSSIPARKSGARP